MVTDVIVVIMLMYAPNFIYATVGACAIAAP